MSDDELKTLKTPMLEGGYLAQDATEAELFVGKLSTSTRARLELRRLGLTLEESDDGVTGSQSSSFGGPEASENGAESPASKRQKVMHNDTDSEQSSDEEFTTTAPSKGLAQQLQDSRYTVHVVRLAWYTDSLAADTLLPLDRYLLYRGRKVEKSAPLHGSDILKIAEAEAVQHHSQGHGRSQKSQHSSQTAARPALMHETTSEHDINSTLPPIPEFLHTTYSCQRLTPMNPPNDAFIAQLDKVRFARLLQGDKIGVRAYSSVIATLSAYPYLLSTPTEVSRLPGCGAKIAVLYTEFVSTGHLTEAVEAEGNPYLIVLKLFYNIWGVAEKTAREFYQKGWRDLDDVVEYGWKSLSRVQQIGVKYYDELLLKISREEVEEIANIILAHARKLEPGYQMVIVGGYRRGKPMSGDVDVIISHPDETKTAGFIERLVLSLEKDEYITHTLMLSTKNTERGQNPVAWRGEQTGGSGFDTLDKAMLVWQNPKWTAKDGESKNSNPHRRVDIIVSPWKTTGCAVLGWTSGTTFQRDLRRYCKKERSLKFDSSGIRSRADGSWVDLEDGGQGKAPDMLTAERRVFEGLGLEWRPPEQRCTG